MSKLLSTFDNPYNLDPKKPVYIVGPFTRRYYDGSYRAKYTIDQPFDRIIKSYDYKLQNKTSKGLANEEKRLLEQLATKYRTKGFQVIVKRYL